MALGAGSVTPLQMASAYSVFANGGYRVNPILISRITDSKGHVLNEAKLPVLDESTRAIDARNAFIMTSLLQEVTHTGTAAKAGAALKRPDIYGKTGTTNDSLDAWFAGWQKNIVAVVWMGYDTPRKLGDRETGGGLALPVWIDYMSTMLKGVPVQEPTPPEGVVNLNGEWYYEEYARGGGVSSVGLEDTAADRADRGGAQQHPRSVPALSRTRRGRLLERRAQAKKRSGAPGLLARAAREDGEELAPPSRSIQRPAEALKWWPPDRAASQSSCSGGWVLRTILLPSGNDELEQAAGASGVDVDHVVLEEAVDRCLDRREDEPCAPIVFGIGKRLEGHELHRHGSIKSVDERGAGQV